MTSSQKERGKFRQSKRWKDLRHFKNVEQDGLDYLTHKKLAKGANLHHLDQRKDMEHYSNLTSDRFMMLNQKSHECVHFLYTYYKSDKSIIDRLVQILELMIEKSTDCIEEEQNEST